MSDLRIIAGTAKGRNLRIPTSARPTGARVRKSLFDILAGPFGSGSSLLDLYAGAGSVGFEAASRGYRVTMIERDARAVQVLERNRQELRLEASILRGDALAYIRRCTSEFDIVFIDPPYVQDINAIAQTVLDTPGLIAPDGVVIVQGPIQLESPAAPAGFVLERREYGSNALTLYWKAPS